MVLMSALPLGALLACRLRAQQPVATPRIHGFQVGQTWEQIGARTMPCESGVKVWLPSPEAVGLQAVGKVWRVCDPRDGHTQLIFLGDTLVRVGATEVALSGPKMDAEYKTRDVKQLWDDIWRHRAESLFGMVDSINMRDDDFEPSLVRHFLEAFWTPGGARWCAITSIMVEGRGPTRFVEVSTAAVLVRQRPCWL